jgi:hypothetical protein
MLPYVRTCRRERMNTVFHTILAYAYTVLYVHTYIHTYIRVRTVLHTRILLPSLSAAHDGVSSPKEHQYQ